MAGPAAVYAASVFSRKSAEPAPQAPAASAGPTSAKGRPTPSRKEAEAARKAALTPVDKKGRRPASTATRTPQTADQRRAARMAAQHGGPVRALARQTVDSRPTVGQFLIPAMVLALVLDVVLGRRFGKSASTDVFLFFYLYVLVAVVDSTLMTRKTRRLAAQQLPGEPVVRGLGFYVFQRSIFPRRWRRPRPGEALPKA